MNQLRDGTLDVRRVVDPPVIHHQFGIGLHVVEQNRAAGGGALTKTGPVIDNAQSRCATTDERQHLLAIVVQRFDRNPMSEQCAGGIELLAIEDAVSGDARLQFQGVFGAAFRPGIADAPAFQDAFEQLLFLRFGGAAEHQVKNAELVLRDLPKRRVGGGNDREDLGQGDERNLRATVLAGDGNAAQAAAGELLDFRPWELALLVSFGCLQAGDLRQFVGRLDGLSVVAQDLCGQQ
ncbi:hypothetical protein D3C73_1084820 [compost metagenome]